jgi:hypothetical protein
MQRLKNGKRRQVPHRKRASFGGSALVVTVHQRLRAAVPQPGREHDAPGAPRAAVRLA